MKKRNTSITKQKKNEKFFYLLCFPICLRLVVVLFPFVGLYSNLANPLVMSYLLLMSLFETKMITKARQAE